MRTRGLTLCVSTAAWWACVASASLAVPPTLELELRILTPVIVAGEPVQACLILRNLGAQDVQTLTEWGTALRGRSRLVGEEWRESGVHEDIVFEGIPTPRFILRPGEERRKWCDRSQLGVSSLERSSPGEYEWQVGEDFQPDWHWDAPRPKGLFTGLIMSNVARYRATVPQGIDWQAYEALGRWPLHSQNHDTLLERFPTSIYAGYAWFSHGKCGSDAAGCLRHKEDILRSMAEPEHRETEARSLAALRSAADADVRGVAAFLAARPEFVLANRLRLKLVSGFAVLDRWEEAREQCEIVIRASPGSEEAKRAQAFLALAREKGYLPKEAGR